MPDGNIKAEEPHPGLLQASSIWFHSCNKGSIIDNPLNGSFKFELCHAATDTKPNKILPRMLYDKVNDYFKIDWVSSKKTAAEYSDVCYDKSCAFLPVRAEVIGVDDYDFTQFYIIIKPSHHKDCHTMKVSRILGNSIYGRVHMIQQPKYWDVYGRHVETLFKIRLEE